MKIAVISDIHDNKPRLKQALSICKEAKIEICFCCGDIASLKTVKEISDSFKKVYIALGNMDHNLKNQLELFPKNTITSPEILELKIDNLKIVLTHHDTTAKELAKKNLYDYVFYGHTHTPWEEKIKKTTILNPGETAGQFGVASFAIFDTKTKKTKLITID